MDDSVMSSKMIKDTIEEGVNVDVDIDDASLAGYISDGLSQADDDTGATANHSGGGGSRSNKSSAAAGTIKTNRNNSRSTYITAIFVILGGLIASICFLYVGISSNNIQQRTIFERHAQDLSKEIISSFKDYEIATAWIHESCRNWRGKKTTSNNIGSRRNGTESSDLDLDSFEFDFAREDFRVLYNYLIDGFGLDFFLAEWVPNITHSEREILEKKAAKYYSNDTNVNYNGFLGLGPNPNDPNDEDFGLYPRNIQEFYFPIQYLEPYERIGNAVHLDLYSIIYEKEAIDLAINTYQPVLTERFVIVSQDTDGYSVSLIHPGVKLDEEDEDDDEETSRGPKDLSLMLIHIRSLLARAAKQQSVSLQVYLYDATKTNTVNSTHPQEEYLGGAKIEIVDTTTTSDDDEEEEEEEEQENETRKITYFTETELEDVRRISSSTLYYEQSMKAGERDWTIVILPVDTKSYQPSNIFAILCGVMIFGASLLLAYIWIIHNHQRQKQVETIINQAAAESAIVSSLFPAAIRDRLIRENQQSNKITSDPPQRSYTNKTTTASSDHDGSEDGGGGVNVGNGGGGGRIGGFASTSKSFAVRSSTSTSSDENNDDNRGASFGIGGSKNSSINDGNMPIAMLYHETTIL